MSSIRPSLLSGFALSPFNEPEYQEIAVTGTKLITNPTAVYRAFMLAPGLYNAEIGYSQYGNTISAESGSGNAEFYLNNTNSCTLRLPKVDPTAPDDTGFSTVRLDPNSRNVSVIPANGSKSILVLPDTFEFESDDYTFCEVNGQLQVKASDGGLIISAPLTCVHAVVDGNGDAKTIQQLLDGTETRTTRTTEQKTAETTVANRSDSQYQEIVVTSNNLITTPEA